MTARPAVRRQLIDGLVGQHHLRLAAPAQPAGAPPLLCLHQSPKSGRVFERFLPVMARDRMVLAPDMPGFGESDPPPGPPDLELYAQANLALLKALQEAGTCAPGPVDVLGYHTGAMVAVVMARLAPESVRRIVLVAVPFFTDAEITALTPLTRPWALDDPATLLSSTLARVEAWARPAMDPRDRLISAVENLRQPEIAHWGHAAAMGGAAAWPESFTACRHPLLVLDPDDDLAEATARACARRPDIARVQRPDWNHGFFWSVPEEVVASMDAFLAPDH